jgi:hypothetical protein
MSTQESLNVEASVNIGHARATGPAPRRLSTHQQSVLIQVLLSFPDESVGVCYSPDASDAAAYAEDFLNIFKAINWTADESAAAENLPAPGSGLAIALPAQQLPAAAEALRDALRIYHLEAAIVTNQPQQCGARNFVLAVTRA